MYLFHKTLVFGSNVNQVIAGSSTRRYSRGRSLPGDGREAASGFERHIDHIVQFNGWCVYSRSHKSAFRRRALCRLPPPHGYCTYHSASFADYNKDLIVLTSDSGCLSILEYETKSHAFKSVYNYKFGETGCLFRTPGQYLRVCPNSSCIAVGACPTGA